jgi:hypothetical protein
MLCVFVLLGTAAAFDEFRIQQQAWVIDGGFCTWANQYRCRSGLTSIDTVKEQVKHAISTVNLVDWENAGLPQHQLNKITR